MTGLNNLSREVLTDGFCMLYEEYNKKGSNSSASPQASVSAADPEIPNFTSLMLYLKDKYDFAEFRDFVVEGGRVVWKRGGRRIEISHEEEEVMKPAPSATEHRDESAPRFRQLEMN